LAGVGLNKSKGPGMIQLTFTQQNLEGVLDSFGASSFCIFD